MSGGAESCIDASLAFSIASANHVSVGTCILQTCHLTGHGGVPPGALLAGKSLFRNLGPRAGKTELSVADLEVGGPADFA